ncbi:MAG: class I SAM-dependent methyltransferase [Magnetococcales bacterium]|nr:class I SAM-dependent methyltransferase [Magnetococcales bacterium]
MNNNLVNNNNKNRQKCPICNSHEHSFHLKSACPRSKNRTEYELVKCNVCSVIYLNPMPTRDNLSGFYRDDYEDNWGDARSLKQYIEYLVAKRIPRKAPGRLLDIGSGTGAYLREMEARGWSVTGVDAFAGNFKSKIPIHPSIVKHELIDAHFPDAHFDVVTMWWIIEHYLDPITELREVRRIIKPNGLLAISTCNPESFIASLWGRYWHHLLLPQHCVHFSPKVLGACLEREGFRVVKVRQVPITAGVMGSLEGYLWEKGFNTRFINSVVIGLGVPFEMLAACFKSSDLYTILAEPVLSTR